MKKAGLLVAAVTIGTGLLGLISPDSLTAVRRIYFLTPVRLYAAGAVRLAMGLVVILCAPRSRAPRTLRITGAVMCLQAFSGTFLGPHRAPSVLEWEARLAPMVLRLGAAVAFATGCFMAFAISAQRRNSAKSQT